MCQSLSLISDEDLKALYLRSFDAQSEGAILDTAERIIERDGNRARMPATWLSGELVDYLRAELVKGRKRGTLAQFVELGIRLLLAVYSKDWREREKDFGYEIVELCELLVGSIPGENGAEFMRYRLRFLSEIMGRIAKREKLAHAQQEHNSILEGFIE